MAASSGRESDEVFGGMDAKKGAANGQVDKDEGGGAEEIILLVGDNDGHGGNGSTLVLNEGGNQQLLSGFTPDILQQALAEVTSDVVATVPCSSAGGTISDQEFSLILNGGGNVSAANSNSSVSQDFLLSISDSLTQQQQHPSSASSNTLSLTELDLNSLLSSTTSSTATISSSCQISPRKDGFVTVLKGTDGSLQVLSDPNPIVSAQAAPAALKRTTTILQPATSSSSSSSMSIPMIRVQPLQQQQQPLPQQQQPRVIQTIIQAPPQQLHQQQQPTGNMILVPTTAPDGTVTYILKSDPRTVTTQVSAPQRYVTTQRHQRPTVFGRKVMGGSSQTTPILRPVMSPGVVKTTSSVGQVKTYRHQHPMILPKMPAAPRPALVQQQTLGRIAPVGGMGQVLPVVYPRSRPNSKPLGSTENPIQLIQEGSTFRSTQHLSGKQLTKVATLLKNTNPLPGNHRVPEKFREKLVIDPVTNARIVYKVIYPEDLAELDSPPDSPNGIKVKDTAKRIDSSDEDSHGESSHNDNGEAVLFHDAMQSRPRKLGGMISRKRGRPRRGEFVLEKPQIHAKKLRKEFGLNRAQIQFIERDLVDDRRDRLETARGLGGGANNMEHEDSDVEVHSPASHEERLLANSAGTRTRSGRVTKPPPPKDEVSYHQSSAAKSSGVEVGAAAKPPRGEPPAEPELKPRRKFIVPNKYRCRVCSKIYLGDNKMRKHVRLYPSHGPSEDPPIGSAPPAAVPRTHAAAAAIIPQKVMPTHPHMAASSGKKMPEFSMPIIPMARTQLEELVKNLDAELVMDVVSKKMFDNFSMWQLEAKKISMAPEKGMSRLNTLFGDLEKMLSEVKKLLDHCLTDTKLCGENEKVPNLLAGDFMQSALTVHEGPWYLEQSKHISQEYHKLLGIQPPIMSPRSDSTNPMMMLGHGGEDDNSNSLMSMSSDKEPHSHHGGLGGAQVVLERNLGEQSLDLDEDTRDCSTPGKKRPDSEFDDSKHDDTHSMGCSSPASVSQEEDSNLSASNIVPSSSHPNLDHSDIDPKKVLEQNGINISQCSEEGDNSCTPSEKAAALNVSTSDLAMEIDSLGPFPPPGVVVSVPSSATGPYPVEQHQQRTRLPSFSSIIGGSPKTSIATDIIPSSIATTATMLVPENSQPITVSTMLDNDQLPPVVVNPDVPPSVSNILDDQLASVVASSSVAPPPTNPDPVSIHQHLQSGPPSVDNRFSQQSVGPTAIQNRRASGPPQIDCGLRQSLQQLSNNVGAGLSQHIAHSGPPSVDMHHAAQVDLLHSGPSSVLSDHIHYNHPTPNPHISGPPSVADQHHMSGGGGPGSVDQGHMSGPPSVDPSYVMHGTPASVEMGPHLPNSPCVDFHSLHPSGPPSVHGSGPPSVDPRLVHNSNPASIDQHHQSIPNSPLSEVVIAEPDHHQNKVITAADSVGVISQPGPPTQPEVSRSTVGIEKRRNSVTNSTLGATSSIFEPSSSVTQNNANPPLIASLGIDSAIMNPGLASGTNVTFTGPSAVSINHHHQQQHHQSLKANEMASESKDRLAEAIVDTNSKDILNELDSMLTEAEESEFPFTSALSSGSMNLKTPEKLLHSIPPSSMMVLKPVQPEETPKSDAGVTEANNASSSTPTASAPGARTNFLGALNENESILPPPPSSALTDVVTTPASLSSSSHQYVEEIPGPSVVDAVIHGQPPPPEEDSNPNLNLPNSVADLSDLFNEIAHQRQEVQSVGVVVDPTAAGDADPAKMILDGSGPRRSSNE